VLSAQLLFPAGGFAQAVANQPAAAQQDPMPQPAPAPAQLTQDQHYLLVLDRFTYGPRPGDLERIRALGLQGWFRQQLNPSEISDAALDERLAAYPAMKLPLGRLMELYPTNQQIKRAAQGRGEEPMTGAEHAIYEQQIQRYKDRSEAKKAGIASGGYDSSAQNRPTPTPAALLAMPPSDRFKALCKMSFPQFQQFRRALGQDQREHLTDGFSPQQVEVIEAFSSPNGIVRAEAVETKLMRDVYSQRQLQEVMVDFWLNHFNVYMKKSQEAPYYITAYERDNIRPLALGHFENLLVATATSPAMLNYLDNSSSIGPHSEYALHERQRGDAKEKKSAGLNENYAREVMELHTIGVNGGYTQHDVTEVAKVFTGWTVGKPQYGSAEPTQAQFDPSKHEPGDKMVMGHRIKSSGQKEGLEVLHLLASSPACARFLSTKLAVRFVSDTPPPAMVDAMTRAYLASQGDIRQVLIAMVNSPEFFTAATYRAKVKTPQDYVISAVRAAGSDVQSTVGLAAAISELGMPVYGHQTPDGYSMRADPWNTTSSLVSRMNFAMALSTNRVDGVSTNFDSLLPGSSGSMTAEEKEAALQDRLLHVAVAPRTRELILQQVEGDPAQQAANLRQVSGVREKRDLLALSHSESAGPARPLDTQASIAAGLLLGSPEFQRR
jgi:uncharacterized protein (DUF1800 family)